MVFFQLLYIVVPTVSTSYCSIFFVFIPNTFTYCGTSSVCTENEATPGVSIVNVTLPPDVPLAVTLYT